MAKLEAADVIDEVLVAWKPGFFEPRELAQAAMRTVGIEPHM